MARRKKKKLAVKQDVCVRLVRYRVKNFLRLLLARVLPERFISFKDAILNDAVEDVIRNLALRSLYVNVYDIACAVVLRILERYGIPISPIVLIGRARRSLRKRVTFSKVLRLLNYLRISRQRFKEQVKRYIVVALSGKVEYDKIREIIKMVDRVAMASTGNPRVLAACLAYRVLRRYGFSSGDLEGLFNVSRYSILRHWKGVVL